MKTSLLKIVLQKEKIFWRRTWKGLKEKRANFLTFFLVIFLTGIAHYGFAAMHFLFESFLWTFNRKRFKRNLIIIQSKMQPTLN